MRGRTVLITGAAGGLGRVMCTAFLTAGAKVIGLDRTWGDDVPDIDQRVTCDLASREQLDDRLDAIKQFGPVDTLVNNAAIYPMRPFEELTDAEFSAVQAVNCEAPVRLMRSLLPDMRTAGFGRVVNITSITLSGEWADFSAYIASKGGLLGLTRAWAREFGPAGITVNAVSPGAIPTEAERIYPDPAGYNRFVIERQAVKRRGSAEDIARAVLFLADKENGFVTGQTLHVDGGWTMQ